jgi:hypothetical protein
MRAASGGREPSSSSAAVVALRALLIATACGLVFALLNLPDGRAGSSLPGESGTRPPALLVAVLVAPRACGEQRSAEFGWWSARV